MWPRTEMKKTLENLIGVMGMIFARPLWRAGILGGAVCWIQACGPNSADLSQPITERNLVGTYVLSETRCARSDLAAQELEGLKSTEIEIVDGKSKWISELESGCKIEDVGEVERDGASYIAFTARERTCSEACSPKECVPGSVDESRSLFVSQFTASRLILREADRQGCSDSGYRVLDFNKTSS